MNHIPRRYSIGLWLTAGALAFVFCLYHLSGTLVHGVFLPADNDSFYHARRIIDALGEPLRVAQFDPRIHAPEGSWITWPWAYAAAMAYLTRLLMALTGAADPMSALAFIAPAWVFVNAALFLGIASRLRLSLPMQALAMLFFATLPMTQFLHRVGMVDHHYIEWTFVLASIYLGLGWFGDLASRRRAAALAAVLGAAPAFHNGLFILQLPVLLTFAWLWALKRPLDRGATLTFGAVLLATTAAFLLPSEPFLHGEFSYYLHSVFHLYVAFCTALLCVLMSHLRFTAASVAGLGLLAAGMAAPALRQIQLGRDFLFAAHPYLERIAELGSIYKDIAAGRFWRLTLSYSPLLWLLPLGIAGLAWRLRRDSGNAAVFFLVQVLAGSFLMLQSFRLHYFGSFALILPLCRLIDDLREQRPALFASRPRAVALGALLVAPLLPGLLALQAGWQAGGGDAKYTHARDAYRALAVACRKAPGVILAEPNDGAFIRYHSDCSTIADNFATTPQHLEKIWFVESLMAASAADVMRVAPYVRYILVKRADDVTDRGRSCGLRCPENAGLRQELLAPAPPAPAARLRLLVDVSVKRDDQTEPFLRLYQVVD
jgi:hypothetical protein